MRHEKRLKDKGYASIAGVDEAGRGPLAGPVVAGCVILKTYGFKEIIDDSKKLSAKRRELAYREIKRKAHVGIGIVDEKFIDKVNIYNATIQAMDQAIENLRVPPDFILVDGKLKLRTPCAKRYIKGGDSKCLSVAAASIIAKVTRDRIMDRYHRRHPEYGFIKHKGYATKQHKAALRKYGPSPIHRFSYKPVKDSIQGDGSS